MPSTTIPQSGFAKVTQQANTPTQGACLTAYATDDLVNSTTHTESVWSNNDTLSFQLAEPYFSDACIENFRYAFSSSQGKDLSSEPLQSRTTVIPDASSAWVNTFPASQIYYLAVEILDKFGTVIGREEFQAYIDIQSPIVDNVNISDLPLFPDGDASTLIGDVTFDPDVSGIEDIARITWEWTAVDTPIRTDSHTVLDPDTDAPQWTHHTFNDPIGWLGGDRINVRIEVEDKAGNIAFGEAGFDKITKLFIGDNFGRTEEDYTVTKDIVYRFAIWDIPIDASDFNTQRCQNSTTYLVLRDECHIHEAQIRFTPGTWENCPNCNFPLIDATVDPVQTFFDSNFPVSAPHRGDDDDGAAIFRYELNERYFNLHEFWNLSVKTRREKLGRDFIDLGTFSDADIDNGIAVGHFEIKFSTSPTMIPVFHAEDSLSGVSGFKYFAEEIRQNPFDDGSDPITHWIYVQDGAIVSGDIGYEPQVDFEPGVEYFYEWRLVKVFPNGDRAFGPTIAGSYTFFKFLQPTSDPEGFGYTRYGDGPTGQVNPPSFGMVLASDQFPIEPDPASPWPVWFDPKYVYLDNVMFSILNIGDNITLQNNDNRVSLGRIKAKASLLHPDGVSGTVARFEIEKYSPVFFNDIATIVLGETGLYREHLIDDGSFQGFYLNGLSQGSSPGNPIDDFESPSEISSFGREFQSSHYRFNFAEEQSRLHVRIPRQGSRLENRLIVKLRTNTDGIAVTPSARDSSGYTLLGDPQIIEKDIWSIVVFDLEDQEINGVAFPDFDPVQMNQSLGITINSAQPDVTYIDLDYIALINRRPERKYSYINLESINPICFNDNRVGNFNPDATAVSNCLIGYRAVLEGPSGPPGSLPNNYESGKSGCFNTACPDYSPIPVIDSNVEFIYDPIASRSQRLIDPLSNIENLSGVLVCPNDRKLANGDPECMNNFLRVPIPPDKKVCSRDEGFFDAGPNTFKYRCDRFSKSPKESVYDTSGRRWFGAPPALRYDTGNPADNHSQGELADFGTNIPADKVLVASGTGQGDEFNYTRKAPDHFFWDYNNELLKCDGTLRDSALPCDHTLVGFSVGQRCPICQTALLRFQDYGVEIGVLVCSNTRKVYQTLFDCSIYQNGVALRNDFTNCPECNTLTKDFDPGKPVVERFTENNNVSLTPQEINKLLSGHIHTYATVGWDEEAGEPSAGYIGGFGGPFTDGEYFAINQFRPTIGTDRDEEIWEARIQKSQDQEDSATVRESEIQDERDQIRFDLTNESRRAGDPQALSIALDKDTVGGTIIRFPNFNNKNVYARYNGTDTDPSNDDLIVLGDSPTDQTLDGQEDDLANWGFRHHIKDYMTPLKGGKQVHRIFIRDLKYINLDTPQVPYDSSNAGYIAGGDIGWMFVLVSPPNGTDRLGTIYIGRDADAWAGAGKWHNPSDAVSGEEVMETPPNYTSSIGPDTEIGRMDKYTGNEVYELRFYLRTSKLVGQATPSGFRWFFYIGVGVFKRGGPRDMTVGTSNFGVPNEVIDPSGTFNPIIDFEVTSAFWDDQDPNPPVIQPTYDFNDLNIQIEMEVNKGGSLRFRGIVNGVPDPIGWFTYPSHNLFASGDYFNITGSTTEHLEMTIGHTDIQPETDFDKLSVLSAYNNESSLQKFGRYTRSSERQYDEYDLLKIDKNLEADLRTLYNVERLSQTYYQIWIDPSPDFDTRNGQPMRILEEIGWTCLAKNDPDDDGATAFHNWQFNSDYCPKYKQTISEEEAIASSYRCTLCNSDLFPARIDREGLVFLTKPNIYNPHTPPLINHLLRTTDMPGESPEDYLMLDLDIDGQQDHEVESALILNKLFDGHGKRYEVDSWASYLRYAGKADFTGGAFDFIKDVDFTTMEHIENCAHPAIQHNHPMNSPCIMNWMSVGRRAIVADGRVFLFGGIGLQRAGANKARYEHVVEQVLPPPFGLGAIPGDAYYKSEFSDIRFSYYIARGLLYRSWWERGDDEANYPSGAANARFGNKIVEVEFGLGFTPAVGSYVEHAVAKYTIWNDAYRDAFETENPIFTAYDNPSLQEWVNQAIDPETIRDRPPPAQPANTDLTDYKPIKEPFDKWHFVSYNLYNKGASALATQADLTWNDINTIKVRIVTTIIRDTNDSGITGDEKPSQKPNHVGIIVGEFQQGWRGRQIIDDVGPPSTYKDVDKFGPRTWDQKYYWKAVPYVLKLNPAYVDWATKVLPDIPRGFGPSGARLFNNQHALWSYGFPPKRFIKRIGVEQNIADEEANGIFKLSKNWTTIVDRLDEVILPDGFLLENLQDI